MDPGEKAKTVKCLVWDLDETLWSGVLLEDARVRLKPEVVETLRALDERGILQSVASKNDAATARAKLEELGLLEYFLYPQISWSSKVAGVERIAKSLNLGIDSLAFIDDQAAERDEVQHSIPQVRCYDASLAAALPGLPEFRPRFITDDARNRRRMYQADQQRNQAEESFVGPKESFLANLDMVFTISRAQEEDLQRAEELTVRTHQLNTTGYTFSYDELDAFRRSADHDLYVTSLKDRYGDYGKIGLALVEKAPGTWNLRLMLMSCRVMNRGVGTLLLNHIVRRAQAARVRLRAEFVPNGRNRMMLITYTFAGFRQVESTGERVLLESDAKTVQPDPPYVQVRTD